MEQTNKQEAKSPIVREYKIGDITYIVKAVVKDGVKEDAATKVRRLIHNDLKREKARYNAENTLLLQTGGGLCGIIYITCLSGCRNRR